MARCLQAPVLAREGIIDPWFSRIEECLGRSTQAYYEVLALVGKSYRSSQNSARPWLHFCLTVHFRQANTLLRRSKEMKRIWDEINGQVSDAMLGFRLWNATQSVDG